ncbi:MAG: hypothetical protein DRR42_10510 [Gammaproteobacteria bacterium]|nr:MAG: hypothetical protein DRQ98_13235 [Gammaproteobacteria bacterium]RLA51396.1 MAG: hypothetical protein DRR42_10510 [Gammaproteobacteria bacterium]
MSGGRGKRNRPDWQIIRSVCQLVAGNNISRAVTTINESNSWDLVIDTATTEKCFGLIASNLSQENLIDYGVTEEIRRIIHDAHLENVTRNMGIFSQALKVTQALNSSGIKPIFLKGTASLLTRANADIGAREQADIDLLVEPDQIYQTCETLLEIGYSFIAYSKANKNHRDIDEAKRNSRFHHHLPPMVSPDHALPIEIHKTHLPIELKSCPSMESLLRSCEIHDIHGAKIRAPSIEHRLIHLILGEYVRDGYWSKSQVPFRAISDYIDLTTACSAPGSRIKWDQVDKHCASKRRHFLAMLAICLPEISSPYLLSTKPPIFQEMLIIGRYNHSLLGSLLDFQGRARHLLNALFSNPNKIFSYFERMKI